MEYTCRTTPVDQLTGETGLHHFKRVCWINMIFLHLSSDWLDNVRLFLTHIQREALYYFYQQQIKLSELLNEVFACECQYSLCLSPVRMRSRGRAHLINRSPVTCSVFTSFVLWTEKKEAFPPSFYLSSHICEFACLLLALFCWCMYFVDKSSAVQLREISWVNSGKCQW